MGNGQKIGVYRILSPLGAGGMGEVWRAEDTKLGREVALKVLPGEFAEDPERMARFEREAKVLASLNHQNIAHLYGLETVSTCHPERAEQGLALSPDGTMLALMAEKGNTTQLWVRAMDTLSARPLEGTENARLPLWSPDGRHLGFFSDRMLKRISVAGGGVRNLADAIEPRGGTWGPDDRIVFSPDYRDGLWSVSVAGGEATPLTQLDQQGGEKSHRWPVFLPGGRHVLFLAQTDEGGSSSDQSSIEALSLADGARTRLLGVNTSTAYSPEGGLLFWREGSLYAQPFDPKRLVVEGEPALVVEDVGYTQNERAVFTISEERTLVYHKGSGVKQPATLEWYDRDGEMQSEAAPVGIYRETSLAPDGRRLAYTEGLTVWVRDLDRGTATRVTDDDEDHLFPVWSPDGRWLAYTSTESGRAEVYVIPVDDQSRKWQVSTGGGQSPVWKSAGEMIRGKER